LRTSRCSSASLPGGSESTPHRAIHRQVEIRVIHYDDFKHVSLEMGGKNIIRCKVEQTAV
jgi:hypothetical protein